MLKRVAVAGLVCCAVVFAGCTNTQKGAGAGGLGGAAVGTAWATSTGATLGTGALAGLGVGTVGGALAADYYYTEEQAELADPPKEELSQLQQELQNTREEKKELMNQIQKERSQKQALLEAHEKTKKELQSMKDKLSGDVKVTREGGEVTFTILSEVLFPEGKASLEPRGEKALGEAADLIRENFPKSEIKVVGHTDNQPIRHSPWEDNWELSGARARTVLKYLQNSKGFDPDRLSFAGRGPTDPVATNDTKKGRRQNRRAEIVVVPADKDVEYERKASASE